MCMSLRFVGEHTLLSGWEDGSLRLLDTRHAGAPLSVRTLHSEPVLCLGAPPDNSAAVSGAADCLVAVTPLRGGSSSNGSSSSGGGGGSSSSDGGSSGGSSGGGGGGGAAGEARGEPAELGSPLCRLEIPTTGEAEHGGIQTVTHRYIYSYGMRHVL